MPHKPTNFAFHPDHNTDSLHWEEWREAFEGGQDYLDQNLKKFSRRETDPEFRDRKDFSPIPTFAKSAILDVRNSIFQRLEDVVRSGGSPQYRRAVEGEGIGVDRKGSSMNSFIGIDVLTELLIIGSVGIYVDAPKVAPITLAEEQTSPYVYHYRREDILNWDLEPPENPGQFRMVLLRDHIMEFDTETFPNVRLPKARKVRFRLVWRDETDGKVRVQFFDENKQPTFVEGTNPDEFGIIRLDLEIVPFIMPDIGESLMKDVASYQRALLNLVSGSVNYDLKSNFPFLTIQEDLRSNSSHLKPPALEGTPGSQRAGTEEEKVGDGAGRYYGKDLDRPGFIAPPTEPLLASLKLQEKLEDDIRRLINLAVVNKVGSRTESAEAKKLSSQGLEAGLSYIGMVLQKTEQQIALFWSMYENSEPATISYPSRYILKQDSERIADAKAKRDLLETIPGDTVKKVVAKLIVNELLNGKESVELLRQIEREIDNAGYVTSNPDAIMSALKAHLVSDELASRALGFKEGEVDRAREDHAENAVRILQAQQSASGEVRNPAARGVPDLDMNPDSGADERG